MMNEHDLISERLIPFDKSWIIRLGVLDLINGFDDCINFLEQNYNDLSDDLCYLDHASLQWKLNLPICVGESGTLYRFLKFASWKKDLKKDFIVKGTLKNREVCNNSKIINYSLEELLKIDNNTSQEGEEKWPSLRDHETDRIAEMELALYQEELISKDHRVVQAITMLNKGKIIVRNYYSVCKSWPQFWKFLHYSLNMYVIE